MRQENARIIAEEVERRVKQELEWHDAANTRPRAPSGAPLREEASDSEDHAAAPAAEAAPEAAQESFVKEFLGACGLYETYGARFEELGYDSELAVRSMDASDLDTLGITALGHRRILLNAVAKLAPKSQ